MKPSEALRKARELITPEGAWTQKEYARDQDGNGLWPWEEGAVCFCAMGALEKAAGGSEFSVEAHRANKYLNKVNRDFTFNWNDAPNRTHAEVLEAFRRAEKLALSEGR